MTCFQIGSPKPSTIYNLKNEIAEVIKTNKKISPVLHLTPWAEPKMGSRSKLLDGSNTGTNFWVLAVFLSGLVGSTCACVFFSEGSVDDGCVVFVEVVRFIADAFNPLVVAIEDWGVAAASGGFTKSK